MSNDDGKIAPSVHLQSAKAAEVQKVAQDELVNVASDAQAILAHVRGIEASFVRAITAAGESPELRMAISKMMEARQWVVTHFTT